MGEQIGADERKQEKSDSETRTYCTGLLFLPQKVWDSYLEMSSTRAIKTCQKCKISARSPYPLLEIVLWLNPQETAEARQWASHNEILKSERGKASVWSPVVRNLFTVFWIKGKEVSWQERGKGRKGVGGGRVTGMLEQKTFKNKIP